MSSKPYRPSNGTEGDYFMAKFCDRCRGDANNSCSIIAATMMFDIADPNYPAEWVEDESGPHCTAFQPIDDVVSSPRCDKTDDMFQENAE
ncbi:hypothetical protein [Marinobacterium stanieri]|uniref:hypothetical protein n=1 Tax=Marinobacterium stanieri TaxID=49186 RepID=UPI003A93DB3B